jgi:hypothetical protein
MMIFFLCNAVEGQLLSTGAFEISLNGKRVTAAAANYHHHHHHHYYYY